MKFHGSSSEFADLLSAAGISGEWSDLSNGGRQLRMKSGATVGFWETKGTVFVQGPEPFKSEISKKISAVLEDGDLGSSGVTTSKVQQIFVVHGHDKETRDKLELALRRLGLEPFILMNSTGGGKTIIEALEGHIGRDYSSSFGVVLLTPDDVGYETAAGPDKAEPRARQNVILETGMLLASLTRERMALLVKGHLEMPSDLSGVLYLGFNNLNEVLPKLVTRLKEVGIEQDDKKLSEAMSS